MWINLMLSWSAIFFVSSNVAVNQTTAFAITDKELFLPVPILSTQENSKLLQQLKLGYKRTIRWNKYQSKVSTQAQNQYFDY